jgi:peroxiredoxin
MKLLAAILTTLVCLAPYSQALAANASASPDMKPLPVGQAAPDVLFGGPASPGEAAQLGVPASAKSFRLNDIKGEAVILVVFSMYCPYCQKEGPELDKMHKLIKDKGLADKVKLVGLGAGNSAYEVNVYREKFKLAFPLLADQDFTAYKAFGQVGTPFYYVLKRQGPGFVIVDQLLGCVPAPEAFVDGVLQKTGLGGGK